MRLNLEAGLLGDAHYWRANTQFQQYFPLTRRFTLGFNAELGWGEGLGGKPYPIFKNFYGGGLGTVRAFDQGSLGPVDVIGAYIGGNRRLNAQTQLYLPVPGIGNDRTLRWFGFLDAGNVWGETDKITAQSLRASVGVGLSWVSPVGPLQISYGRPIRKQRGDRIQPLQFQIGTAF
jgi:outer membrane protein insertion porin family